MREIPVPKCKAILICESTIMEADTGLITIVRTFNQFVMPEFPGHTEPFELFVQLTDGIGRYDVHIEVHDLIEDRLLARSPARAAEWEDRLVPLDLIMAFPSLPIAHPGSFDVIVFANGQEVDRQQFRVIPGEPDDVQQG